MGEYFLTLLCVALLCGGINLLAPDGTLKSSLRTVTAICFLCATVSPIASTVTEQGLDPSEWLDELIYYEEENYVEIYNQNLINVGEEQAAELVKHEILSRFSLSPNAIDVFVLFEVENEIAELGSVRLLLRDDGVLIDPRTLISFVEERYGCSCTVVYD